MDTYISHKYMFVIVRELHYENFCIFCHWTFSTGWPFYFFFSNGYTPSYVGLGVCVCVSVVCLSLKLIPSFQPGQSQEGSVISISHFQLFVSRRMPSSMHRLVNYATRLLCFRPFHMINYWTQPLGHSHAWFFKHSWPWFNRQDKGLWAVMRG